MRDLKQTRVRVYNGSWDDYLKLTPANSQYYAILIKQKGRKEADRIWKDRHSLDIEKDYNLSARWCRETNEKINSFLKRRSIKVFKY